ncbi:MAG TPA: tRNA glutamyl-Q(34) synthetase GluQRS, partial [Alphaproteobacteria bacterium]|nr:tRNA glutamyl-Q(34) synthetase GluQRS [Alphaproteobacteria bacterium]
GIQNVDYNAGDIVLARKDIPTSYHLAVTLDDHRQRITLVTRGMDLFNASHVHRLLQGLLGLNTPEWEHHKLIIDEEGGRLSKRGRALTIQALRRAGESPASVRAMVGFD